MAECSENSEDKAKLFDEFKAKIAEAKLSTSMGKYEKKVYFSLFADEWKME